MLHTLPRTVHVRFRYGPSPTQFWHPVIRADSSLPLVVGIQAERRSLDAKEDFEDVSKLTKAEMARFDKEKIEDFKKAVVDYADGMVVRQREVRPSASSSLYLSR